MGWAGMGSWAMGMTVLNICPGGLTTMHFNLMKVQEKKSCGSLSMPGSRGRPEAATLPAKLQVQKEKERPWPHHRRRQLKGKGVLGVWLLFLFGRGCYGVHLT